MADLEDLLIIAGAIGVGMLIAKKKQAAAATTAPAVAAVAPPAQAVQQIPDEGAELYVSTAPVVEFVPYPNFGWGVPAYAPNFNFYGGGRRGGHRGRRR
jgi:hypothetical protein